ncbi:MAG: hypothetical protein E7Z96_01260 [Actinomycetaceae bacterium]|nr:hypothetical protein [Actinomycetaceae bacterium]
MRIYIPATIADLEEKPVPARIVHGVTAGLEQEIRFEDTEVLEAVAMNAAADASLRLIAQQLAAGETLPLRRMVLAADVPPQVLSDAPLSDELVTARQLASPVDWDRIVSIHVDDGTVAEDVQAAAGGDDAAFDRLADSELMWYDVTERLDLARALTSAKKKAEDA